MALSSDLISQFVKVTKDDKKVQKETTVYGTVVYDGKPYVKLDGSDLLTPISTTTNVQDGERVTVMIKNHTATVTGNISSPSARTEEVENVASQVTEFGTVVAHKVTTDDIQATNAIFANLIAITGKYEELTAVTAEIEALKAGLIEGETLKVTDIEAITAKIESIESKFGEFVGIETEDLEAYNAEITNLKGYTASFTYISSIKANIKELEAKKVSVDELNATKATVDDLQTNKADVTFANIDFANVKQAKLGELYARSGIIQDYTSENGVVTGKLVAVEINADKITSGTLSAERIMLQGDDGLFYKFNVDAIGKAVVEALPDEEQEKLKEGIHGKSIIAESITADKIKVSDLTAFGATIAGLEMEEGSIHTFAKDSVGNMVRGFYLDSTGQMNVGDSKNFIKFYEDAEGNCRLEIAASAIILGASGKNIEETIKDEVSNIEIGARNLVRNSTNLIFADYYFVGSSEASDSAVLGTALLGSMILGKES